MRVPPQPRKKPLFNNVEKKNELQSKNLKPCNSSSNVIEINTDKKKISILLEKISNMIHTEPRGAEKAAFILTLWTHGKK